MASSQPISFPEGVSTLFTTCVECFKYFKGGHAQRPDYELLECQFDLIKSRMLIWGNAIGIGNVVEGLTTTEEDLSQPMSFLVRSLNAIKSLREDCKSRPDEHGLRGVPETTQSSAAIRDLPSLQPLNLFQTSRLYIRFRGGQPNSTSIDLTWPTGWVIFDKEKFEVLVARLKELVDTLERFYPIPVAARDQTLQSSVAAIGL